MAMQQDSNIDEMVAWLQDAQREADVDGAIRASKRGLYTKKFGVKVFFEAVIAWVVILVLGIFAEAVKLVSINLNENGPSWAILFVVLLAAFFFYNKSKTAKEILK